jgi:hypothetical protein
MSSTVRDPEIGQWYERSDNGAVFQVTGVDDSAKTIELQAIDGDLDEVDPETWAAMPLELRGTPEDWLGPIDDMEADDLACSEAETMLDNPEMLERLCADTGESRAYENRYRARAGSGARPAGLQETHHE